MAKKKFEVNIMSLSSIEQIINELRAYQNSLEKKIKLLCWRLADIGLETARATVYSLDAVFTGELFQSLHIEQRNSGTDAVVLAIVANSQHAVFVEFGTGIIGKENPYPGKLPEGVSWQYASGKTIRQLLDGRYGWFYYRDDQWYFTEGMPSRPFMYFATLEIQKNVVKIAKEVFG